MASTVIHVPGLVTGLTASVRIRNPSTMALVETVTLTETNNVYSGNVATASSGRFVFEILVGTAVSETRVRSILDTVGPFVIDSDLDVAEAVSGWGYGPRAVQIDVEDDSDDSPIENSSVRIYNSSENYAGLTDVAGEIVFGLVDGTYNIVVTRTGFGSHVGTITVSADATEVIQLTSSGQITIPTDPQLSTGLIVAYDEFGAKEEGVEFELVLTAGSGTAGRSLDTNARTATSAVTTGLVQFTGLIRGATYSITRGTSAASLTSGFGSRSTSVSQTFIVPDSSSFDIVETLGKESA